MKKVTLEAKVENIESITNLVNDELKVCSCPIKTQVQIDVAIDELLCNIARYSGSKNVTIQMEVTGNPPLAKISFIDSGIPFNPLEKKDPNTTLSAEERKIGGLGIFIVKKSMDSVEYERKDGKNILTIKKTLKM